MKIYKYEIPVPESDAHGSDVTMPAAARILTVAAQGDRIYVWAAVDPGAPLEARRFWIHGTGHDMSISARAYPFLGTVFLGAMVFHVFGGVAQ